MSVVLSNWRARRRQTNNDSVGEEVKDDEIDDTSQRARG